MKFIENNFSKIKCRPTGRVERSDKIFPFPSERIRQYEGEKNSDGETPFLTKIQNCINKKSGKKNTLYLQILEK